MGASWLSWTASVSILEGPRTPRVLILNVWGRAWLTFGRPAGHVFTCFLLCLGLCYIKLDFLQETLVGIHFGFSFHPCSAAVRAQHMESMGSNTPGAASSAADSMCCARTAALQGTSTNVSLTLRVSRSNSNEKRKQSIRNSMLLALSQAYLAETAKSIL